MHIRVFEIAILNVIRHFTFQWCFKTVGKRNMVFVWKERRSTLACPSAVIANSNDGGFDWESPTGNSPRDHQLCEFSLCNNFVKLINCVVIATKVVLPRKKENIVNLCLVSRRFSDITCPILFSHICLGGFTSFQRHRLSQLKELSKGDTKASALAKHLSIDYFSSFPNDPAKVFSPLEKVMLKHLKSAIRSFRAITTMSCVLPERTTKYIFNERFLGGI